MSAEKELLQAVMTQAADHLREAPLPSEVRSALCFFASPRSSMAWMADVLDLDPDAVREAATGIARRRLQALIREPSKDPCSRRRVVSECGGNSLEASMPPEDRIRLISEVLAWYLGRPWG